MSGISEHAADEAAGEEIFTSEGREPPVVMSAPPIVQQQGPEDDKALLETTGLAPEKAFEIFAGKIYPIASSSSSSTRRPAMNSSAPETPWQRLARLQLEAAELEKDLSAGAASASGGDEPSLLQAVRDLQGRLAEPSTVAALSSTVWQERLTQQVADSTASLTRITSVGSMEGSAAPSDSVQATAGVDWEARIRKLEKLVGTGAGLHESHSLLERLTVLEKAASKLSEKDLEVAMKKAKVIRQDLEAASKARNKLISSRDANAESSKSIAALHDQMTQLQGLTALLPVLTQRLQALASQHSQATTWTQRLAATEQRTGQLLTATTKIDASLKQLEESLKVTAEQMTANMKALDSKLS